MTMVVVSFVFIAHGLESYSDIRDAHCLQAANEECPNLRWQGLLTSLELIDQLLQFSKFEIRHLVLLIHILNSGHIEISK